MTVSVGVRELRGNLRAYLDGVKNGEEVLVTEHGVPIARIVPARGSKLEQLVAAGIVSPAKEPRRPLPPPVEWEGGLDDLLREERDSQRY